MKAEKIEHIGIAVNSLAESIPVYEKILGTKCYAIEEVKDQFVRTAFFKVGESKIELLEATHEESPISSFLERYGEGLHHIAFAVEGLHEKLSELKNNSIRLIDRQPRKGAENMSIAFVNPKSSKGALIEFCEDNAEKLDKV